MVNNKYELSWESPKLDYYWHHNFVYSVYKKELLQKWLGIQENEIVVTNTDSGYSFYIKKEAYDKLLDLFFNNPRYEIWKSNVASLKRQIDDIPWEIVYSCQDDHIDTLEKFENLFHLAVSLHFVTQPHFINVLKTHLYESLVERYNEYFAEELIKLNTMLKELPDVILEQLEWYDIVLNNSYDIDNALNKHLSKWKYITAGDSKQPMDLQFIKNRYQKDINSLDSICNLRKALLASVDVEVIDSEYLTYYERNIASKISEMAFLRFQTKAMWMKLWYLIEQILSKLQEELNFNNIFQLTIEEIKQKKNNCENDRNSYFYTYKKGYHNLYYNDTEKEMIKNFNIDYKNINVLNGEFGHRPLQNIVGQALVITWNDDITENILNVDKNTILVLPQITPSFMALLPKCKGIICDEGGIAGHASIISRELKIPCVVGTRIATKVYQTGDTIEIKSEEAIISRIEVSSNEQT